MHSRKKRRLICNWKMNLSSATACALVQALLPRAQSLSSTELWIAPAFTLLPTIAPQINGSAIRLGAQNVHWADSGAFTGEISPSMLRECGCTFALVGHSERRQLFHETEEECAARARAALAAGLGVVFCVGETTEERAGRLTEESISRQLAPLIAGKLPGDPEMLLIAYEPVWAIGGAAAASPNDIVAAHRFIRGQWRKGSDLAAPQILYGGSVTPENFGAILSDECVDGALVGRASLSSATCLDLLEVLDSPR